MSQFSKTRKCAHIDGIVGGAVGLNAKTHLEGCKMGEIELATVFFLCRSSRVLRDSNVMSCQLFATFVLSVAHTASINYAVDM